MAPDHPADNDPHCSFCGKRHDEVYKLIAGPRVNICDECVNRCYEILAKEAAPNGA